jgi:vacuolar-type H+-ATPase subunit H
MKKTAGIIIKIFLGFILVILVLLFTIPIIFKEKIRTKVTSAINESLNAKVTFSDYKLGFFRNFPNLSFSLEKMSVTGAGKFEGDTLAAFRSFDLVFNLMSLFSKSGYEVKSIKIDKAKVNAIVLKNGSANWEITKPSVSKAPVNSLTPGTIPAPVPTSPSSSSSGSSLKILLRNLEINNSSITYSDSSLLMDAQIEDLNFKLAGSMTFKETILNMTLKSGATTVIIDGVKYLNKVKIDSKINMLAELDSMKFTMRDNFFSINDLKISLSGSVSMPGKDIKTDLHFGTDKASFKTFMSLVPSVYMSGYEDLKASGEFSLSGSAKGIYSDADSSLPDININFIIANGLISYPALPEKVSNINVKANVFVDGKVLDRTIFNLEKFHFELAGSPFDMTFFVKTPMSDPDFKGSVNGKIDLTALSKAVPMSGISLSGIIDMALSMSGKLSMIEKEQYESFNAKGTVGIKNMIYSIAGYPRVEVRDAALYFTPAYTRIESSNILVEGKSDFSITGDLGNYIPYILRNKTLKANLALHSNVTDVSAILKAMSDSSQAPVQDTAGLAIIPVPKNIDFDFNALIEKLVYNNIKAEKVKGHIIARDGMLSFRNTGMNILGGTISMNADYDTRDTLKPVMKADFDMQNIGVRDAFNTFNTVKKLAPAARGIDGKISARLTYVSLLGSDMMPVINSINGTGNLKSNEITLLESKTFDQMKEILKLGDKYSNTFKDINLSFKIADGRVFVSPFDVRTGNLKMNISGDQGLDQTLNYIVKTEIPRSDLGSSVNSFIDNLSAQASAFGIKFKPADIIKVNVKVTGTFTKPVVAPYFGESTGGTRASAQDAVKQTVDNAVDNAKEKARAEAEIQGAKLVKEAEERGQQLRDQAAKTADDVRKEADAQAQKLIDDNANKGQIQKMAAQKGADSLKKNADKKADQLVQEADAQANKLVEEAKAKKEEMVNKI